MKKSLLSCALAALLASSPTFASGIDEAKAGLELAEMGLGDLAAKQFKAALGAKDLAPAHREKTFYNLGTVYLGNNRPDLALKAFDQALKLSPRESRTLINRAEALRGLRQHDAALNSLDQALAIDKTLADAHFSRGLILLAQDRLKEADAAFRTAKKQKSDPRYDLGLGRALLEQERYEEAVAALNDVIVAKADWASAYVYRSAAYHAMGKKSLARDDIDAALRLAPYDPVIRGYYEERRYGKRPVLYKTKAEVDALASPRFGAPVYTRLPMGTSVDSTTCEQSGWCRVMLGHTLAGYVKKTSLAEVADETQEK